MKRTIPSSTVRCNGGGRPSFEPKGEAQACGRLTEGGLALPKTRLGRSPSPEAGTGSTQAAPPSSRGARVAS